MFFGVQKYIEKKDDRLRKEIRFKLNNVFNGRSYIDVVYSGKKAYYDNMVIPKKPEYDNLIDESVFFKEIYQNDIDKWNGLYNNIYKMYQIKWDRRDRGEWVTGYEDKDGWNLVKIQHDHDGYLVSFYFPYAVGYFKQNDYWLYQYEPSIQNAVDGAFDFFTTNVKSNFINEFERGSSSKMSSAINACENEYYWIVKDDIPRVSIHSNAFISDEAEPSNKIPSLPYHVTSMYNNYYKVLIAESQPQTYSIQKMSWRPDEKEKMELWFYWSLGLTLILISVLIPIGIIERKHNKIKKESLYDKLLRLCNPANFMKDYDKDKVEKANEIYQRLLGVNKNDIEAIKEVQLVAVSELGLNLIDSEKLTELIEKVNPKNFMNPYNAEKVNLANELYSILMKENLMFEEFVYVEEKSAQLI